MPLASVLDYRRQSLDPAIWVGSGNDGLPIISEVVQREILSRFGRFFTDHGYKAPWIMGNGWISNSLLVGSIATYQWEPDSDIDVTVVIDFDKFRELENRQEDDVTLRKEMVKLLNTELNEQPLSGTKHPINYFLRPADDFNLDYADSVYNLVTDEWLKAPPEIQSEFDPEQAFGSAFEMAQQWATKLDMEIGEAKRDVKDYDLMLDYIQDLPDEARSWLATKIQAKVDEIEADVIQMVSDLEILHQERAKAFVQDSREYSKEDLLQYSRNWLPENIIYKFLERYNYIQLLKKLKNLVEIVDINESEFVEEVSNVLNQKQAQYSTVRITSSDLDALTLALTSIAGIIYNSGAGDLIKTYAAFRMALELIKDQLEQKEPDVWQQILEPYGPKEDVWQNIMDPSIDWSTYTPTFAGQKKQASISLQRLDWFSRQLAKFEPIVRASKDQDAIDAVRKMRGMVNTIGFVDRHIARETYDDDYSYIRDNRR